MQAAEPAPGTFTAEHRDSLFAALAHERHIALAVSGGSDSIAMMRLADMWARSNVNPVKLTVLTVDHGLRHEAAAEALQVSTWCKALSLRHHTLQWQGVKPKTGVQAKARNARYGLMSEWCAANGVDFLLTAHTLDDQAETVFMRQGRTGTVESLAGIWETAQWGGVKLFRPLLGQRRIALRTYLNQIGQTWIDDPSNDDVKFERVRVRKTLATELRPDQRMAELADIASVAGRTARALVAAAAQWVQQHLVSYPEGYGVIPRPAFCHLEADLQRRVLQQLIRLYGAGNRVDPSELDGISAWILGDGLQHRTLGGAVMAGRKHSIVFGREAGRVSAVPTLVPESGEVLWDGRFMVKAPPGSQVVAVANLTGLARRKDIPSFVQQAMPAILLHDGSVMVPHLGPGQGAAAKFIRYLR